MIKTTMLREMIKLGLLSAYVINGQSVSIVIIAKPESGKTQSLLEFSCNDGLRYMSDITYTGLINVLEQVKGEQVRTLLVPDLLKVFGRKADTAKNFITLLNEFIEEGIIDIQTFQSSLHYDKPVRGNLITAITSTEFFDNARYWGVTGFLSRVIPFSYGYSASDVHKIFESLMRGERTVEMQKIKQIKKKPRSITLSMPEALLIRDEITMKILPNLLVSANDTMYGFRIQKSLQTLAKASALSEGRTSVNQDDVDRIKNLSKWMNYQMKEIE